MFAVGKGTTTPSGCELQRTILNLIPTNSVLKQMKGGTADLPTITQYLPLVVQDNEKLTFYQSDMQSAFYLFRLPKAWSRICSTLVLLLHNWGCLGTSSGGRDVR